MCLEESQIRTIIQRGVKKAKSLLSFHISSNNINTETLYYIREQLKITYEEKKVNDSIEACHIKLSAGIVYDELKDLKYETYEIKQKLKILEDINAPLYEINLNDKYVFTRYLGV